MKNTDSKHIYLDYAAATPVRSSVLAAMQPYRQDQFANPQAQHQPGRQAADAVTQARQSIAAALSVQASEIIFTSGATEANNLALLGVARAAQQHRGEAGQVLVSAVAHASVRGVQTLLAGSDTYKELPVTTTGRIDVSALSEEITDDTILVSVSHANSEIGTVAPLNDIAEVLRSQRQQTGSDYPLLHVDASQTALYHNLQPEALKADLLTINSQKFHGPKGVGCLWVRSGTPLVGVFGSAATEYLVGDYQKLRPGTPPTPLIVGCAEAFSWAQKHHGEHYQVVKKLADYALGQLEDALPSAQLNGHQADRTPHIISLTFPSTDHDYLATQLDTAGIAVSTTSACQAEKGESSDVLDHIDGADEALRISFGIETTTEDIDQLIAALKRFL